MAKIGAALQRGRNTPVRAREVAGSEHAVALTFTALVPESGTPSSGTEYW